MNPSFKCQKITDFDNNVNLNLGTIRSCSAHLCHLVSWICGKVRPIAQEKGPLTGPDYPHFYSRFQQFRNQVNAETASASLSQLIKRKIARKSNVSTKAIETIKQLFRILLSPWYFMMVTPVCLFGLHMFKKNKSWISYSTKIGQVRNTINNKQIHWNKQIFV